MPVELTILAWASILLLVHIFAAAHLRTKQYGTKWNMGARDEAVPELNPLTGRLIRAQANFQETLPIAIIALIGVVVAGKTSDLTAIGGWTWLIARAVYLPLYGIGVPIARTIVFVVSMIGIGLVFQALVSG